MCETCNIFGFKPEDAERMTLDSKTGLMRFEGLTNADILATLGAPAEATMAMQEMTVLTGQGVMTVRLVGEDVTDEDALAFAQRADGGR